MPTPRTHPDRVLTNAERQKAFRQKRKAEQAAALVTGTPTPHTLANVAPWGRWRMLQEQARTTLQAIQSEMEEYHDQRSEEWQEDERGQAFEERQEALNDALDAIENLDLS